jgi:hypothetical protein
MRNLNPSGRLSAVFFSLALFLLICPLSNAQQVEPSKKARPNSLQKGAWSLQFELDNNFRPRTFEGSILNIKRQYSERTAVRLGVSISIDVSDEDGDAIYVYPNRADRTRQTDREYNNSSYDLLLHYLFYPLPKSDMHLFLGVGPHFRFAYLSNASVISEVDELNSVRTTSRIHNSTWNLGTSGVIGVEWFLRHNVSLLAEYGIFLDYRWENRENSSSRYPGEQISDEDYSLHGFGVRGRPVKFGISVYF